jgi:hypothetical protein
MITDQVKSLVDQLEAALAERQQALPEGFVCHAVACRIAECYERDADGASGFWIARARWTVGGRPTARAVFDVMREDGTRGVWDALTREEGEVVADVLTNLSL